METEWIIEKIKALNNADYEEFMVNAFDAFRPREVRKSVIERMTKSFQAVTDEQEDESIWSMEPLRLNGTGTQTENSVICREFPLIYRGDLLPVNGRVFFDVESLTLKPSGAGNHQNVASSVSIVDENSEVLMSSYVKWDDADVCSYYTSLTGITKEMLENAPKIDAVSHLCNVVFQENILVGFGVNSDLKALSSVAKKTEDLKDYFVDQNSKTYAIRDLVRHFFGKIVHDGKHSALVDARLTRDLYQKKCELQDLYPDFRSYPFLIERTEKPWVPEESDKCKCEGQKKKNRKKKKKNPQNFVGESEERKDEGDKSGEMSSSQLTPNLKHSTDLLVRLRELALARGDLPSANPGPSSSTSSTSTTSPPKKKGSVGGSPSAMNQNQKQQNHQAAVSPEPEKHNEGKSVEINDPVARQMEALKKLLECPVCLQMPGTPMYLCTHGHSICHGCRLKLVKCPLCNHPILNTRNLVAEQIIGALDTKCRFASEGCAFVLTEVDKKKHESNCHFRGLECNFTGPNHKCKNVMVRYSNFIKHMIGVHKMNGLQGTIMNVSQYVTSEASKLTCDIPWNEWPVQYMDACNQIFITGSTIMEGTVFWWLYVFGDRKIADKYKCKIVLQNKDKGLELSWSGPVFHIRMRPNVIKKMGLCLMANHETLKSFSYEKTVQESANNMVQKVAWDLVFHVFKV